MRTQTDIFHEIIVDNFAGGGGASTGIELACGIPVTVAVNHDPDAILMHQTNHPFTEHYQASVWDIDPRTVCRGRPVGLAWFSPDCKHFSKAKGGKPVDKKIRGLAWIALRWAGMVRPRVIMLENVEEFQTWGPVRRGKPIKEKAGQTFRKFISQLEGLGYEVQWRELVAADYGAPTIRKRFFLIARCDGRPIVWPEPTHAPRDSEEVRSGRKLPWRSAAEIIDWSLPCPSIFDAKEQIKELYGLNAQRPLHPNTLRRVARGLDKFVLKSGEPFLVQVNHTGENFRGQSFAEPMPTITGKHGYGVTRPVLCPWTVTNTTNSVGEPADAPIHTVTTAGNQIMVAPALIQYHTEQTEAVGGQEITRPICTVDAANRYGLMAPVLVKYYSGDHAQDAGDPLHTVTTRDREWLCVANLTKFYGGVVGASVGAPVPTVTAVDHNALQLANVVKFKGDNLGQRPEEPLQTVTAGAVHHGVIYTTIYRAAPGEDFRRWTQVRELLNTYCGYHLAEDEVILLWISGVAYFIGDIGLRMLTPRELYAANGFPPDYIIDRDYLGNAYGKSKQVARCGNAVPPPFATALVRANLPEWCGEEIHTMEAFERMVAV